MAKRKKPEALPYDKARLQELRKMTRNMKRSGMTAVQKLELKQLELVVANYESNLKQDADERTWHQMILQLHLYLSL